MLGDTSRTLSPERAAHHAMVATKETALLAAHKSADAVAMGAEAASSKAHNMAMSLVKNLCMNKEKCKALILHTTYETRKGVLTGFKDLIKTSLTEDPNMCDFFRKTIARTVDMIWAEVEEELERDLEAAVLNQLANEDINGPVARRPWTEWYWRGRRYLLSHYFPHNKSVFGKLRDPVYVSVLMLSLAPVCGVRFVIFSIVLVMLWTPGPPDEYMLLNFIMLFKGFQFISTGILKSAWATMVYYYCLSSSEVMDVRQCAHSHGPTSVFWFSLGIDYMGNVLLTWIAWFSLGYSAKYAQNRFLVDGGRLDPSKQGESPVKASSTWTPSVFRHAGRAHTRRKGGLFNMLMCYDSCCFTLSLILLVSLTHITCSDATSVSDLVRHPQFAMNVFWANVVFSVTTLPFLPLNIPWLFSVFTQSTPTGFNENGACVAFRISLLDVRRRRGRPSLGSAWSTMKSIKDFGRSRRREMSGIPGEEDPKPGYTDAVYDFSYGLYRAVLYAEMDSQEAAEIPEDMVMNSNQLLMVWDRF